MLDSILNTIKKMLGIPPEDDAFDIDILVHINMAMATLHQVGVGPESPALIVDATTEWSSLTDNVSILSMAKSFIYLTVKTAFDPAGTSFIITSIEKQLAELIYRLELEANPPPPLPIVVIVEE